MYCKYCGKQIDDKAVMCVHCGRLLTTDFAPRLVSAYSKKAEKSISGLLLSLIVLILPIFSVLSLIVSSMQFVKAKKYNLINKYALSGLVLSAVILTLVILIFIVDFRLVFWEKNF